MEIPFDIESVHTNMAGKSESPTLNRLKSKDEASKISTIFTLLINRILPLGGLSFIFYESFTELTLDDAGFEFALIVYTLAVFILLLGLIFGDRYNFTKLEEAGSRQEWLDALDKNIKTWIKSTGPGFKLWPRTRQHEERQVQHMKETFAAHLAGSYAGIPPLFSQRELLYWKAIYFEVVAIILRLAASVDGTLSPGNINTALDQFIFGFFILLLCCVSFLIGRRFGWYEAMGEAARKISKKCRCDNVEKWGDTREQLEWWIEALVKEEPESKV